MQNRQPQRMQAIQLKNWLKSCMEILLMILRDNKKSGKLMIGLKRQKRATDKLNKKYYKKRKI